MTVGELISVLSMYDENTPVAFAASSGDYWGTQLALSPDANDCELVNVVWSQYHRQNKIVEDSDEDEDGEDKVETLVFGGYL